MFAYIYKGVFRCIKLEYSLRIFMVLILDLILLEWALLPNFIGDFEMYCEHLFFFNLNLLQKKCSIFLKAIALTFPVAYTSVRSGCSEQSWHLALSTLPIFSLLYLRGPRPINKAMIALRLPFFSSRFCLKD